MLYPPDSTEDLSFSSSKTTEQVKGMVLIHISFMQSSNR